MIRKRNTMTEKKIKQLDKRTTLNARRATAFTTKGASFQRGKVLTKFSSWISNFKSTKTIIA